MTELYALADLDGLTTRLVKVLPRLIATDVAAYAEVDLSKRRLDWKLSQASFGLPQAEQIYLKHMRELPLFESYRRGDGPAVKISDFLTQRAFHRTGLYNEFYRRVGLEHHLAKGLPGPPGLVTSLVALRSRKDFGERDRRLLNLLRPHLNIAYQNAVVVTAMKNDVALLTAGVEDVGCGAAILAPDGRITMITPRARQWITEYFGRLHGASLPERLRRWVDQARCRPASADDAPGARHALVVHRGARRLSATVLAHGTESLLLFEEHGTGLEPRDLESLGLSRRQAEILGWVAEGKTNPEIGTILGLSFRTIEKHLERIFKKLGVETRTAAAARALAVMNDRGSR